MVGMRAAEIVDELITVGERGRMIAAAACRRGFSTKRLHEFDDSAQTTAYLRENLQADDVVLIKGSRGMRMDRIVADLEARR